MDHLGRIACTVHSISALPRPARKKYNIPKLRVTKILLSNVYTVSKGLAYECNDKGVLIQCVCPGAVLTDMLTKVIGSKDLPKHFAFLPTPEVFAKQALNTLGFSSYRTAGYWAHSLLIKSGILEYTGMTKMTNRMYVLAALKQD